MSALSEINRIIRSHNPFDGFFIVKSHQVWGQALPDVPSLNNHASKAVMQAIEKINDGTLESTGITMLAPKGVGKTHILSRIRHRLQRDGNSIFIYLCEYGDLSQVKQQFLQGVIASLRKPGSADGTMQCQMLITALINQALDKQISMKRMLSQFPQEIRKKPYLIDQLTSRVSQIAPNIEDPDIIKALIWTLSSVHAPYALSWLSGKELTQTQSQKMGLPNTPQKSKSAYAFSTALQLLNLIGKCFIPVICFDELDGTESGGDDDIAMEGYSRAQVIANLGKDVYNSLKKGILVTAMYPITWNDEIKVLPQADAVTDRIAAKKLELHFLKADDVVTLISCWLTAFYIEKEVAPPHPLYPFTEGDIRNAFADERPTVREVLRWCSKNFGPEPDHTTKLEKLYEQTCNALEEYMDDTERIASALAFGFQSLSGKSVEGFTVDSIEKKITPKSKNKGYIQFKVIGREADQLAKIGVCISQDSHGRLVGAQLRRLTWYKDFDLTRGCLVRKKHIPHYWQIANEYLDKLLKELSGEWVSPEEEDIRSLIALHELSKDLPDYEISEAQFHQFLVEKKLMTGNAVIKEILSAPSGEEPDQLVDEDEIFEASIEAETQDAAESENMESELALSL